MHTAGDDLISIDVVDPERAQALAATLRDAGGWLEVVAGIESVVVRFDIANVSRAAAETRLREAEDRAPPALQRPPGVIEIPIVYGGEYGPDLELVCKQLGLTTDGFIDLHCGTYSVDMLGFTPGFAYIGGLDDRLLVQRLSEPRQHIPAGSVGIAGGRTGLYSLPGPGGWPLIGRTSRQLFDPASDAPFALAAGARVTFTVADKL